MSALIKGHSLGCEDGLLVLMVAACILGRNFICMHVYIIKNKHVYCEKLDL